MQCLLYSVGNEEATEKKEERRNGGRAGKEKGERELRIGEEGKDG
jgi:hypothetical protein